MTGDDSEREQTLRRLLTEAVEPVTPKPGHEARFQARLRVSQKPGGRVAAVLGWSAAGLSTAAIVVLAVLFAGRGHDATSSTASAGSRAISPSRSSSPSSSSAATERGPAAPVPAGPSRAAAALPSAAPDQQLNSDTAQGTAGGSSGGSTGSSPKAALVPDLDGDGIADTFTLDRGSLVAELSRAGLQSVTLPATGVGARVLDTTRLVTAANVSVPVVFVRLSESSGKARDVVAGLVNGRLTLLQFGSRPAVLTVDATHGYGCSDGELAVSGNPAPYVVDVVELVASPRLRAVMAAVGQASGC